jgi:hypothetical protein
MTKYGKGLQRGSRTEPIVEQSALLLERIRRAPVVKAARVVRDKQQTSPSLAVLDFVGRQTQYLSVVRETFAVTDSALLPPARPLAAVSPSSPNSPNTLPAAHSYAVAVGLEVVNTL